MHANTRVKLWIAAILLWQIVVWMLSAGGIFVNIYELLGIDWNSIGAINVIGTIAGIAILESPLIAAGVVAIAWSFILRRLRRTTHANAERT